jgi:hypothetical protein
MQVINKAHPSIKGHKGTPCYVTVTERYISFTAAAASRFGLKPKEYMHFLNDGGQWLFYTNDDKDGFEMIKDYKEKNIAVRIFSAALCNMIKKSVKPKEDVLRFYINKTERLYQGNYLCEILTDKTIEVIGK